MANSREKGSAFERQIAKELLLLTGISFKRDLDQYRQRDRGDLIPDDPAWPFTIECKAHASGTECRPAWKEQARAAALAAGKIPCVIWKFNHRPISCAIPLSALCPDLPSCQWVEVSLRGLAFIAADMMARRALELADMNMRC